MSLSLTLQNYAYVLRQVARNRRSEDLTWEQHKVVGKPARSATSPATGEGEEKPKLPPPEAVRKQG